MDLLEAEGIADLVNVCCFLWSFVALHARSPPSRSGWGCGVGPVSPCNIKKFTGVDWWGRCDQKQAETEAQRVQALEQVEVWGHPSPHVVIDC